MRKFSTTLIFILMVSALFLPFFPVKAQSTIPAFKIGVTGGAIGSWDGAIASAGFAGGVYSAETVEPLALWPTDWDGDFNTMIPVLATDWTITYWPEEMNYHPDGPFMNRGGVRAIEFTLREGVKFHDGSDFNATVAKWNIDRDIVISGNLTGKLTPDLLTDEMYKAIFSYWLPATHWSQFETDTWNVSQFIGQPASYAEYGATKSSSAHPIWGWLYDWAYDGAYSRIKNVTITEDKLSGGKIKVYYNDWSAVFLYVDDHTMYSMDAYKDYFDTPIKGLGDVSGFEQPDVSGGYPSTGFPGHLIGTGPYRFIEHDDVLGQGTMERFDDWWNSTAMQALDLHKIPEIFVATFPITTTGFQGRNLAIVTGDIDYTGDDGQLVYADMVASPDINYVETGIGLDRDFITLNNINETYWKDWADWGPSVVNLTDGTYSQFPWLGDMRYLEDVDDVDGRVYTDGINRAIRKAVSYAFDYDTYINVIRGGRAVRSDGFLPSTNEYYNPSFSPPYRDLTIARQALIDDPFLNATIAARGLDITNSTEEWNDVANSNPIFEFKLLWDISNYDKASVFGNSIKDIGMTLGGLNGAPDGNLLIQPDVYTVLFGEDVGSVPWFTAHGVPSNWGSLNYKYGPVAEYYYRSPGSADYAFDYAIFPFEGLTNIGFHYNATVDRWIDMTWFVDRTTAQELWDNLTRHFNTYQYAEIMISSSLTGFAINKDFEWQLPRYGYAFVKYIGTFGGGGVQIPGFEMAAVLSITIVAFTGIGLSLNRKRKRA
ncbi:hypothetical protein LCGC14_1002720 [marine sediment metagenome]|uniref:Solute-binding protein family 5 domain-containing protein n=1 Tax=marine sediment metagenome TaxID=412755 RepID=A0A0F9NP07_9ZZZZ